MKNLIFGSGVSAYKDFEGLRNVCRTAVMNDILKFDTAPSYKSEEILSKALLEISKELGVSREKMYIQTKIDPIQMYDGRVVEYFKGKLKSMKLDYVDALLIHWPLKNYLERTWNEMQEIKRLGLTRKIGICNLRIDHLKSLEMNGLIPEILQIERHPLNTFQSEVDFCHAKNIEVQDYSPLCKMHPLLKDNENLNAIAEKLGKNVGQIILKWHIDTGATPIFTSKKNERIVQYSDIDDINLEQDDIEAIASLNMNHKLYLESLVCPGF
ncbi:MAG: aldo/keto reductase [Bacteroidales bacterium]|nr:aldo/keto reductase [Bacteroidales bacterium]